MHRKRTISTFIVSVLFVSTYSDVRTIERTNGLPKKDIIKETDESGNLVRNETCSVNQVAVIIGNQSIICEERTNLLNKLEPGCISGRGSEINLFPYLCNDTTSANFTSISYGSFSIKKHAPKDCLKMKKGPSKESVVSVNCTGDVLDPGILYKLDMRCLQLLPPTMEYRKVCVLLTVSGVVKEEVVSTTAVTTIPGDVTTDDTNSTTKSVIVTMATTIKTNGEGGVTLGESITSTPVQKGNGSKTSLPTNSLVTIQSTTDRPQNTTISPGIVKDSSSSKVLIYVIISSTVVLIILLSCLAYFCCFRPKKAKEKPADMESLYAKPTNYKRKEKSLKKTKVPYFGPGYDEVGAIIPGIYEDKIDENEDSSFFNDHRLSSSDTIPLKLLGASSNTITDDPYEFIGRSNSFTPKRPLKRSKEDITNDFENRDIDAQDSPCIKPNGSIRIKQNRTSVRKGKFNEKKAFSVHEDVTITPPVSTLSSVTNIPNVLVISPEESDLNKVTDKLKEINKSDLSIIDNISQKSNSYEEIWNIESPEDNKKQTSLDVDPPYERIPSTNEDEQNKPIKTIENKDQSGHLNVHLDENGDQNDSGYEEIWSSKNAGQNKETIKNDSSTLNYPAVEIKPRENNNKDDNNDDDDNDDKKSDYVDVVIN